MLPMSKQDLMQKVVSLAKRRGFVFPGSEIYGGLANSYDYGPLGVEMLRNIKNHWWKTFVQNREEIYGVDASIIMHPKVWEASGHTESFTNVFVECKKCQNRLRVDHVLEDALDEVVEGRPLDELSKLLMEVAPVCEECGSEEFTEPKTFNLLFETSLGSVPEESSTVYLRGETAQGMFVNYKNVVDSMHPEIPFGLGQIGKAFRNEVTLGNFIFRTFEFEQMEIEYFVREENWEVWFERWQEDMMAWIQDLGVSKENLRWRRHTEDELSHYSKRTEDIEYKFPFGGFKELYGLAYRTDYDLRQHMEVSGEDLHYRDQETGEEFIPHVVEPTFGVSRTMLVLLLSAYQEEDIKGRKRVYLSLDPRIAPYKVAVFPLVSNKPEIMEKAREVYQILQGNAAGEGNRISPRRSGLDPESDRNGRQILKQPPSPRGFGASGVQNDGSGSTLVNAAACSIGPVVWDDRGNIGKRYYAQDEIGTPWCVTVDYDTLEDNSVTIRDRDTTEQIRVKITDLCEWFLQRL